MSNRRPSLLRPEWVASLRTSLQALGRMLRGKASPRGAKAALPPRVEDPAVIEARPLRESLRQLLDLHPASRQLMRHLGYVERALARHGTRALEEVPAEVLATALEQLDAIVSNWSDRDLAELRSRMAVALKHRSEHDFFGPNGSQLSNFATASRLLVGDVAHSVFEELQKQYQGLLPQDRIQAVLGDKSSPAASPLPG